MPVRTYYVSPSNIINMPDNDGIRNQDLKMSPVTAGIDFISGCLGGAAAVMVGQVS